ncbi:interferon-induced very large GTPase 1-like [Ruditapes philippinarum]|uniref:interferon-induced very large GTPase 1-like n=1 Tax=Ruditapes philippinarum TaxID=129788 RepID=UPI00295C0170|nr:interferon-induced very large GTPase 1-like [Ruditapes philippinarum]
MRKDESSKKEIKDIEQRIIASDNEIDDLTLNVDHLFRELGYIYETSLVLKREIRGMPPYQDVAIAVADLLISGMTLELIDGDRFLLPVEWIKLVFRAVSNKIGRNNVLSISVLGLQSSGKSTMLNSMFGTQFLASVGRCTKGINMQLIPIKKEEKSSGCPFNFIFLLDTEGLRAPEFCDRKLDHDNELATFIAGIGDITILNIKGENLSEINDILHVVVHAFLRLKLANENLDIRKQCYFVHQNVTNILASEKKRRGLEIFHKTLDTATKDAAEIEGILDVVSFNEIIEFDINTHVWHMPNLWQGSPPMEFVNAEYSKGVFNIKQSIIRNAIQMKYKSFKSLNDTMTHAGDLWEGVLSDNFVFAFRNSLEIKAYIKLTEQLNSLYRIVENRENDTFISTAFTKSSVCETAAILSTEMEQLMLEVKDSVRRAEDFLSSELQKSIDDDENREITEKWREPMLYQIKDFCKDLKHNINNEISRIFRKQNLTILTSDLKLEKEFHEKSIQVANELKTSVWKEADVTSKFEEIWRTVFVNEYSSHSKVDVTKAFDDAISKQYERERPILSAQQKSYQKLPISKTSCSKLCGTFREIGVCTDDYVTSKISFMPKTKQRSRDFENANDKAEKMFEIIDQLINGYCTENSEVTNSHICEFVHKVDDISKRYQTTWSWSSKFRVRLIVHIHACAENSFKKHNSIFLQIIDIRLEQKKAKGLQIFKAHIDHREAEEKAAIEFISIIETKIRQIASTNISFQVTSALCDVIPTVKYHLIVEILTELARNENFDDFILYNSGPENFAARWIFNRAQQFLFRKDKTIKSKYSEIACFQIHIPLDSVRSSVFESVKKSIASDSSFDKWIKSFVDSEEKCGTTVKSFELMKSMLQHDIDFTCLQECIVKKLEDLKLDLENEYEAVDENSVKWDGRDPIQYVVENVWGCKASCPFCGEPCAYGKTHAGRKHYALQHKPKGIKGHYNPDGKEASITTCNVDIQMRNKYFPCKLINYVCSNKRGECGEKEHKFFDYRDLFPKWDIKPGTTVESCSKFWAWFMVHFKRRISRKFLIKVNKIPPYWQNISKDDAIDSLHLIYS